MSTQTMTPPRTEAMTVGERTIPRGERAMGHGTTATTGALRGTWEVETPYTAEELRTLTAAINEPGPGRWDIDRLIRIGEARTAAIWANPSGFPRAEVQA
jgi:hypothetical protein